MTGVQTCALPICDRDSVARVVAGEVRECKRSVGFRVFGAELDELEIGRASCRERV